MHIRFWIYRKTFLSFVSIGTDILYSSVSSAPRLFAFFITLSLLSVAYFPIVSTFHQQWIKLDYPFSHGYLVVLLIAYYVTARRDEIFNFRTKPNLLIFAAFIFVSLLAVLAQFSNTAQLGQILLPLILLLAFSAYFGADAGLRLIPYLLLFIFAQPFMGILVPVLQSITVFASGNLLGLLNIPSFIQGHYIEVRTGVFHVANGCSGLGYFLATTLIAYVWILEEKMPLKRALMLMLFAAFIGMLSNWVRVASLIALGHFTSIDHPMIQDHFMHGWWINGVFIVALIIIVKKSFPRQPNIGSADLFSQIYPRVDIPADQQFSNKLPMIPIVLILTLPMYITAVTTFFAPTLSDSNQYTPEMLTADVAFQADDRNWIVSNALSDIWRPYLERADFDIAKTLSSGPYSFYLVVSGFNEQKQGRELLTSNNRLLDDSWHWMVAEGGTNVKTLVGNNSRGRQQLVSYWYQIGASAFTDQTRLRVFSGLYGMLGVNNGAYIYLSTPCFSDCERERQIVVKNRDVIGRWINQNLLGISINNMQDS